MMSFIFIAVFFSALQGEVPVKDREAFIREFDKVAGNTTSIQCDFVQRKFISFSKEPLTSEGVMYYQNQDMRWDQKIPNEYVMVVSGDVVTILEGGKKSEHSLSSNKLMRGMKEIMVGSITGNLLKSDQFETTIFENASEFIVKLVPISSRLKKMFEKVKLTFDRSSYRMKNVVLSEPGGDYTEIVFSDAVFNKKLSIDLFSL